MAFGLGHLRWPPEVFWAASPREIIAASAMFGSSAWPEAPDRGALAALMQAHPDLPANDPLLTFGELP